MTLGLKIVDDKIGGLGIGDLPRQKKRNDDWLRSHCEW
jgi:hypothetical protein